MDHDLLQVIIDDLINSLRKKEKCWADARQLNPSFEQLDDEHWAIKRSLIWIHGSTDILESIELEQWKFFPVPISKTEESQALHHYSNWVSHILENGIYADFTDDDLPKPENNETLSNFINRLAAIVEKNGWGKKKHRRAINAFLDYLRKVNYSEEVAFIDHVFPEKKDLNNGRIIRIVRPQVHGISIEIVADIIMELAYKCAHGRPNARHHAGEALALVWMCLTASRIRLPRTLECIHGLETNALILSEPFPELIVPSKFGNQKIRISNRLAKFLQAIANIPSPAPRKTILQTSIADLRKPLNKAIEKANPPAKIGEITFLTFLSSPHYFGKNIR